MWRHGSKEPQRKGNPQLGPEGESWPLQGSPGGEQVQRGSAGSGAPITDLPQQKGVLVLVVLLPVYSNLDLLFFFQKTENNVRALADT